MIAMSHRIEDGMGRIIEQTLDNGDGTGTLTVFHDDGTETGTQLTDLPIVEVPPETASDKLAKLAPEQAEAVVTLGLGLVMQAGPMWDAMTKMSPTNTARPVLDVIVTVALDAGLQLLETQEKEEKL